MMNPEIAANLKTAMASAYHVSQIGASVEAWLKENPDAVVCSVTPFATTERTWALILYK